MHTVFFLVDDSLSIFVSVKLYIMNSEDPKVSSERPGGGDA